MKEWITDWAEDTTDPDDGGGPIEFWWDDMRRKEILRLIQEVYERAYQQGLQHSGATQESPKCTK